MIRRDDLPRVIAVAESHGFRFRHAAGVDMLLLGESTRAIDTVNLRYGGDNIDPVRVGLHGRQFQVIPVPDLVRMKLARLQNIRETE
jgi:hypothetical protein